MPVYEYVCKQCNTRFELRRSFSDSDEEVICPSCGASHPERQISSFSMGGGGCDTGGGSP